MTAAATALVTIGARAAEATLVGAQAACHARIRENLRMARRLASAVGASVDDVRETAARVRRYFSIALPLHILDEDESMAPRLRKSSAVLTVTLDVLAEQHLTYQPLVDWMLALLRRIEESPNDIRAAQTMLGQTLDLLESQFQIHLELEEQIVFPALERLPLATQQQIMNEMRRRRA